MVQNPLTFCCFAYVDKGEVQLAFRLVITVKQRVCLSLHALRKRVLCWVKPPTTSLVFGTLADLTREKAELIAENALLREQLIILHRQIKRPVYRKIDRMLLVLLARMVRTWKQALFIVQPETLLRWHRELFHVFWKHTSKTHVRKPRISPETISLIKEMAAHNRLWGAERIRGELLKLGIRKSQTDDPEVYAANSPKRSPWTDLEDIPAQSYSRDMGLRFLAGDGSLFPSTFRLLHHRIEIAQGDPCEYDALSRRSLGRATTAGGYCVWRRTKISDSG
jgi:hypothetical protein